MTDTSWQKVGKWYQNLVDQKGHYYHQHVVIPGVLRMLDLKPGDKLLDLACGQGVLARVIPKTVNYLGIDIAANLIDYAQKSDKIPIHQYQVADVTGNLDLKPDFTHAAIILSLQNIEFPEKVIANTAKLLQKNGKLIIVLNHPCFRIPRQSSWETDEQNKLQYRRINRYLSPLKIPVNMHPGETKSPVTWSFHRPLSIYFGYFHDYGFWAECLEEWGSDKESVGPVARRENRARHEFPLFMAIKCIKKL